MAEDKAEFKHLVRIVNTDLDGNRPILQALRKIKGVNFMLANFLCHTACVDRGQKAGNLKDVEIKKIEQILETPFKFNIPLWLVNRRKDYEEGTDKHILGGDLRFNVENDIKRMKKIKCYRGMRHAFGLPVRGQRTKSNFRRNKGKVQGVKKRSGAKAGRT